MRNFIFWRIAGAGTVLGLLWISYEFGKYGQEAPRTFASAAYADDDVAMPGKVDVNDTKSFSLQFAGPFKYSQVIFDKELPVNVDYIRINEKLHGNYLTFGFMFNGKKDPRRIIVLNVAAKNSSGKLIAEYEERCHDARIVEPMDSDHAMRGAACIQNTINVDLGKVKPGEIAHLELKFTQEFLTEKESDEEENDLMESP